MLVPLGILAWIVTTIKFYNTKNRLLQQLQTALATPAFMRDVS